MANRVCRSGRAAPALRKRSGITPNINEWVSTWSYQAKSPTGSSSIPACFCSCQCSARSRTPVSRSPASSRSPCQNASSARFSSRSRPIRGKPRLCAKAIGQYSLNEGWKDSLRHLMMKQSHDFHKIMQFHSCLLIGLTTFRHKRYSRLRLAFAAPCKKNAKLTSVKDDRQTSPYSANQAKENTTYCV